MPDVPAIAVVKTRRADMKPPTQPEQSGKLRAINIEFTDNGGGTVTCIHGDGDQPFGGTPKTYAFESPETLTKFVQDKISAAVGGAPMPSDSATMPGTPGPEAVPPGGPVDGGAMPDDGEDDSESEY